MDIFLKKQRQMEYDTVTTDDRGERTEKRRLSNLPGFRCQIKVSLLINNSFFLIYIYTYTWQMKIKKKKKKKDRKSKSKEKEGQEVNYQK